jgi:hypothetical protein
MTVCMCDGGAWESWVIVVHYRGTMVPAVYGAYASKKDAMRRWGNLGSVVKHERQEEATRIEVVLASDTNNSGYPKVCVPCLGWYTRVDQEKSWPVEVGSSGCAEGHFSDELRPTSAPGS